MSIAKLGIAVGKGDGNRENIKTEMNPITMAVIGLVSGGEGTLPVMHTEA